MKIKADEVFVEEVLSDGSRRLLRLRFVPGALAVKSELLAGFHARIVATEPGDFGALAVVAGHARRPFVVKIPARWLLPGGNSRAAHGRIINAGGAGTFCAVGKLSATFRAILQLTNEGEPMPKAREVGAL
jgi:hypothetical protein